MQEASDCFFSPILFSLIVYLFSISHTTLHVPRVAICAFNIQPRSGNAHISKIFPSPPPHTQLYMQCFSFFLFGAHKYQMQLEIIQLARVHCLMRWLHFYFSCIHNRYVQHYGGNIGQIIYICNRMHTHTQHHVSSLAL